MAKLDTKQLRYGLVAVARPLLIIALLEAAAYSLLVAAWKVAEHIPLVSGASYYRAPEVLIRGALAAVAFSLAMLGLRVALIALSPAPQSASGNLTAELQALIDLERQETIAYAYGLRLVTAILGAASGLGLIIAAALATLALLRLVAF